MSKSIFQFIGSWLTWRYSCVIASLSHVVFINECIQKGWAESSAQSYIVKNKKKKRLARQHYKHTFEISLRRKFLTHGVLCEQAALRMRALWTEAGHLPHQKAFIVRILCAVLIAVMLSVVFGGTSVLLTVRSRCSGGQRVRVLVQDVAVNHPKNNLLPVITCIKKSYQMFPHKPCFYLSEKTDVRSQGPQKVSIGALSKAPK